MSTINHHIPDAMLMAYAAGELSEALALVVATHISLCDECRSAAEGYAALGGCILDQQDTVALSADSFAQTMARIAGMEQATPAPPKPRAAVPAPLADYIGACFDDIAWRPVGMGVKQAVLTTDQAATARMLYIPAGQKMPDHSHRGQELTLVLAGAFSDDGVRFARGDVEFADGDVSHTPVADPDEPCICLAATDAPLRFRGLLPRLAQPFLGI